MAPLVDFASCGEHASGRMGERREDAQGRGRANAVKAHKGDEIWRGRCKGDEKCPDSVALSRFRGSAPPVPPRELARETECGMRRPKGDEKCPGAVALSRFRGGASPGMPRGHARETKYGTEWLEGDGYHTDSVTLERSRGNVNAEMLRPHARVKDCTPKVSPLERFTAARPAPYLPIIDASLLPSLHLFDA